MATVPTAVQLIPSLEYCHAPSLPALAVLATISTPARLLALEPLLTISALSANSAPNRLNTVAPGAAVDTSSSTTASVTAVESSFVGASLSAVTLVVSTTALALSL